LLLKEKDGQEQRVVNELQSVLSLLPSDSPDRAQVEKELGTAKEKLSQKSQELKTPSKSTAPEATQSAQPQE